MAKQLKIKQTRKLKWKSHPLTGNSYRLRKSNFKSKLPRTDFSNFLQSKDENKKNKLNIEIFR